MKDQLTGIDLLGEVISWEFPLGKKFGFHTVRAALQTAGFDPASAPELKPRSAFTRAAKGLAETCIIRVLKPDDVATESPDKVTFQLTEEYLSSAKDRLDYTYKAQLVLDKHTGDITGDDAWLCTEARRLMDEQMGLRSTSDVSKVIKGIYAIQGSDLWAMCKSGGVYFVAQRHVDLIQRTEAFVRTLGGHMNRLPIPRGTPQGDRSIQEAVTSGIEGMIQDHLQAIEGFDPETREDTFERMTERIKETRFKVAAYAEYLESERGRLEEALEGARVKLKEKIEARLVAEDAEVGDVQPAETAA